jgi:hypothetical protein
VVRVEAWFAMAAAFSSEPPFSGRLEGMIADPGLDAGGAGAKPPAVRLTAANRIHGVRTTAACRLFASGEAVASFPRSSQAQYYSIK